jgi:cyclopropane fatty-acyl-phospholipid synthase-like methyltransferase
MRATAGEASTRFRGERGAEYSTQQARVAESAAILDAWKFEEHVRDTDTVVDFGCGQGALLERLPAGRRIGSR